jgi:hypothetical protein
MSFVLISHVVSILFIEAKCEEKKILLKKKLLLSFFDSVYFLPHLNLLLPITTLLFSMDLRGGDSTVA